MSFLSIDSPFLNAAISSSTIVASSYLIHSSPLSKYSKFLAFGTYIGGSCLFLKYKNKDNWKNLVARNILNSSMGISHKINTKQFLICAGTVLILNNGNKLLNSKQQEKITNYKYKLATIAPIALILSRIFSVYLNYMVVPKYQKLVNIMGSIITATSILSYSPCPSLIKNFLNPISSLYLYSYL